MFKRISITAILIILIAAFITSSVFAARAIAPKKTTLIFTFDAPEDNAGVEDSYFDALTESLKDKLLKSPVYAPYVFNDRMSVVLRGKDDSSLKSDDITGPYYADLDKVNKLASLIGADTYITGSVDNITVDSEAKTASITLSGKFADTKTGKTIMSWLETGNVPVGATAASDVELRSLATADAINKVYAIIEKTYTETQTNKTNQQKSNAPKQKGLPPSN